MKSEILQSKIEKLRQEIEKAEQLKQNLEKEIERVKAELVLLEKANS